MQHAKAKNLRQHAVRGFHVTDPKNRIMHTRTFFGTVDGSTFNEVHDESMGDGRCVDGRHSGTRLE